MSPLAGLIRQCYQRACILIAVFLDAVRFLRLCLRPSVAPAAENLFLRTQLALYQARQVQPWRATNATRFALVWLAQWFDWQSALTVVQPETFTRWQRQGCRLFWRGTACPGRPPIPVELQGLIRQMGRDNLTWSQRRIANELRLKLGLQVSPRTVRTYLPPPLDRAPDHRVPSQRWRTFLRNHAQALIIRGVPVDLTQGVQAFAARLIRGLQGWWHGVVKSRGQEYLQRDTVPMGLRHATVCAPLRWSVGPWEAISEEERSPPDTRPSCYPRPCLATRVTPVNPLAVRPTGGAGCSWPRARVLIERRASAHECISSCPMSASGMTTRAEGVLAGTGGQRRQRNTDTK